MSIKISALPTVGTPLVADLLPTVQAGVTSQTTTGALINTMAGFIPAGTGSVPMTVQAKLQQYRLSEENGSSLGDRNTGLGTSANAAMAATGTNNTSVGYQAGKALTTGDNNTVVGCNALATQTTASNNTAVGEAALGLNTSGHENTAVGQGALANNVDGNDNTALGVEALNFNVTGDSNTAVGQAALRQCTGDVNTAVGEQAGAAITSGSANTALGYGALVTCTTASGNTAVGRDALALATGAQNTAIGVSAGNTTTTGSNNVVIGNGATATSATTSNEAVLGPDTITLTRLKGNIQAAFKSFVRATGDVASNTNVTGDGTTATVTFNAETWDQAGNFAANTFTCPASGKYRASANVRMENLAAGHTVGVIDFVVNAVATTVFQGNVGAMRDANDVLQLCVTDVFSVVAAQTATMTVRVINGAKTVDLAVAWTIEMVA